jgi:molybdenum cofactor cytidylyltransferase
LQWPGGKPMSGRRATALHGIILAAGASRRFGSPKQLVRVDGHSLLQRTLAHASGVLGSAITVVLGAHAAEIAETLPPGNAGTLINRNWQEGIASSIRIGVQRLPGACDGVMLVLADQPLVGEATLNRLATAWRRQPRQIVASQYGSVTGVPAIFPRWCFGDLSALRGDQGARLVIRRHADHVVRLAHPEAAVDIDYPEDLLDIGSGEERVS